MEKFNGDSESASDLSLLYKAHTALAQTVMLVDKLVLKAHTLDSRKKIIGPDIGRFCDLLSTMAASLQEWIPVFEEAAAVVENVDKNQKEGEEKNSQGSLPRLQATTAGKYVDQNQEERQERDNQGPLAPSQEDKEHEYECTLSPSSSSPVCCAPFLAVAMDEEAYPISKEWTLSDSPLVPWLDRVQFFMLTPMARKQSHAKTDCSFHKTSSFMKEKVDSIESFQDQAMEKSDCPDVTHGVKEKSEDMRKKDLLSSFIECPLTLALSLPSQHETLAPTPAPVADMVSDNGASLSPGMPESRQSPLTLKLSTLLPPESLGKCLLNEVESREKLPDSPILLDSQDPPPLNSFSSSPLITPLQPRMAAVSCQMPPSTHHNCSDSPAAMELASPLPPHSLMKRYSRFLDVDEPPAAEEMLDSPMLLIPMFATSPPRTCPFNWLQGGGSKENKDVKFSAKQEKNEEESLSGSSLSSSPLQTCMAAVAHQIPSSTQRCCFDSQAAMELATPLPPHSLMKRYSRFLDVEETRGTEKMLDCPMELTPPFATSPPKTCILMKPHWRESSMDSENQEPRFQTPVLLLTSPFRTPGLYLQPPRLSDHALAEDFTSSKKDLPPRPPESVKRTPLLSTSRVSRILTVRKPLQPIQGTPCLDMPPSTVRKPGAPRPGEQTLKRELWSRMEAEFASMAEVRKSLFSDNPS